MTTPDPTHGYDAAMDAEILRLRAIANRAHQRGPLEHYVEMAAAASVPRLVALLQEARAALPAEYLDLANRIDDALRSQP